MAKIKFKRAETVSTATAANAKQPGDSLIDYREVVARHGFAEHAARADRYFATLDIHSSIARKPFAEPAEASELCGGLAALLPDLMLFPGARVLDFGAGTCWMTRLLALLGCEVVAVDVSRKALEVGERLVRSDPHSGQLSVQFVTLSDPDLPFAAGTFDRVVCFDALHHVPDQQHAIAEFARVLKDGGIAALHEPGPEHSRSAQSQYEMRMHDVIEADVHVEKLVEAAFAAGITRAELAVYGPRALKTDLVAFNDFLANPQTSGLGRQFIENTAAGMGNRRTFFLYKGDTLASMDSRSRSGLQASINVSAEVGDAGTFVRGTIANTGTTRWLPSFGGVGSVNIGVHLHGDDGSLVEQDYARFSISTNPVAPGESKPVNISIPHPEGYRRFELTVDLVAEGVSWFEVAGGTPARFMVSLDERSKIHRL